jgi:hypothetical protein
MLHGGGQPLERALASVAILRSQVAPDWRSRRFTISWLAAAAVFVSLIALVPLGFVASATLETGGSMLQRLSCGLGSASS